MLIVCPSCASRYSIDDDKIGASGRKVRCASCRSDFFVSLADDRAHMPAEPAQAETAAAVTEAAASLEPAMTPAAAPQASSDDGIAAQWLADMEKEGNPVSPAGPSDASGQPQDLDQASLNGLFEAEMAAAQLEAEAEAAADAGGGMQAAAMTQPVTGWRKFLPRRRNTPARDGASQPKAPKKAARPPARQRQASAPGKPSPLARLKGPLGLGLAGVILLAGAVMQRQHIVKAMPASAGLFSAINLPVNLMGLEFADIRSVSQTEREARFLIVEGGVRSIHSEQVQVPLIEIRLRGEDGRTLYTWTTEPPRKSLKPGEALHFRTRLATPPEAGRNVEVRFTDKLQSAKAGS